MSSEGKTVRLEPKVMGVLLCLAQHPGETLSKEQLFQAVWPNTVVTEDALKRCIAELRRAFNDDARKPSIIQTISKRGSVLDQDKSNMAWCRTRLIPAGGMALDICFDEVVSLKENRLIKSACERVGKAITKVQPSRVSTLTVFAKATSREISLVCIDGYKCYLRFCEEKVQVSNSIGSEPRLENHRTFDERSCR